MNRKTILAVTAVVSASFLTGCQTTQERGVQDFGSNSNGNQIPHNLKRQPNDDTIAHYEQNFQYLVEEKNAFRTKASLTPREVETELAESKTIKRRMLDSAALSFLFMENGKLIYDETAPQSRFGDTYSLNDSTYFMSHSMGKSISSYIAGHAICQGYIESTDSPIDWDLLKNTLYYGQPLRNVLNMTSGDSTVIGHEKDNYKSSGRQFNSSYGIWYAAQNELLNSKPGKHVYSYSNPSSNLLLSYVAHKVGDQYYDFLDNIFANKIKVAYPVTFQRLKGTDNTWRLWSKTEDELRERLINQVSDGNERYSMIATRYDYLRIAMSIMEDWQNNSCVGKYLKDLYVKRVKKNRPIRGANWFKADIIPQDMSFEYAGQFHTGFAGLGENVLAMQGYGGQTIVMDMKTSRIVIINSATKHWSVKDLVYKPLKHGMLSDSRKLSREEQAEIKDQKRKAIEQNKISVKDVEITVDMEPLTGSIDGCSDPMFAEMMGDKCN